MALSAPPASLASLKPFLVRADAFERGAASTGDRTKGVMAYFLRYAAASAGVKAIDGLSADDSAAANAFILELMTKMDADKRAYGITRETEPTDIQLLQSFAFGTFKKADDADRAGAADGNTANAYAMAVYTLEALKTMQGEGVDGRVAQVAKYAKGRSAEILLAMREGRAPPPPKGGFDEGALAGLGFDLPAPPSFDSSPAAGPGGAAAAPAPSYSSSASAAASSAPAAPSAAAATPSPAPMAPPSPAPSAAAAAAPPAGDAASYSLGAAAYGSSAAAASAAPVPLGGPASYGGGYSAMPSLSSAGAPMPGLNPVFGTTPSVGSTGGGAAAAPYPSSSPAVGRTLSTSSTSSAGTPHGGLSAPGSASAPGAYGSYGQQQQMSMAGMGGPMGPGGGMPPTGAAGAGAGSGMSSVMMGAMGSVGGVMGAMMGAVSGLAGGAMGMGGGMGGGRGRHGLPPSVMHDAAEYGKYALAALKEDDPMRAADFFRKAAAALGM